MYRRILLPIDGSPLARAAALGGIELARTFGAAAVGLYVIAPYETVITYPGTLPFDAPSKTQYQMAARQKAETQLQLIGEAARAAGVAWQPSVVLASQVAKAIIVFAKRNKCDLIVMGSHGRRGIHRFLLGSVTNAVLAGCHVPVMVHRARRRQAAARGVAIATPAKRAAKVEPPHTW